MTIQVKYFIHAINNEKDNPNLFGFGAIRLLNSQNWGNGIGEPYETLITRYLKTTLHMYDTRTRVPAGEMKRFMQGYNDKGVAIQWYDPAINTGPDINTNLFYAGGPSMNSTMNDTIKYLDAQVDDTDPAIQLTHQLTFGANPKEFAIGLNWMFDLEDGVKDYYHDGHTGIGFNTFCEFYPAEKLGFMILVNDTVSQDKVAQLKTGLHKAVR